MARPRDCIYTSVLAAIALVSVSVLLGACGATTMAEMTPAELSKAYADAMDARYDDVFPDDRVQTVRISMSDADWELMQADLIGKVFYRADITIDGEVITDVAVRTKGSSSLMGAATHSSFRAGLKVDFNFFNAESEYHGVRKLVYNNGYSDPTLMKDFLSFELMALMGIPAPRACFVDLWVNEEHVGMYTQVEAIDLTFLIEHFRDGYNNLYKPEVHAGALDWVEADVIAEAAPKEGASTTTTSPIYRVGGGDLGLIIDRLGDDAGWIPGINGAAQMTTTTTLLAGNPMANMQRLFNYDVDYLTSAGLRTNEDYADYSRLFELLEVLNSEPSEVSADDLERVLDVDEVLRYLAASVVLVHLDNYIGMGHNYYLYEDGGRFSLIPWDLNMTFGAFASAVSDEQLVNFYIDEPTAAPLADYPLVLQLMDEPEYVDVYHTYLRQMIEGPFSVERMTARIDEIADLIRPYVKEDTHMFSTAEVFEQSLTESPSPSAPGVRTGGGTFIGLLRFVRERTASIAAQLEGRLPAVSDDGAGNGGGKGMAAFGPR